MKLNDGYASAWLAPAEAPQVRQNEIHLWRAFLDLPPANGFGQFLSADEIQRANRFYRACDRQRYVAARDLLRSILSLYVGDDPQNLRFTYGSHGKPALLACTSGLSTDVRFNLSHSGGLALYAFGRGREVGVDVEEIREIPDADAVSERFFSGVECRALQSLPDQKRAAGFFRCWTRKEAYVKGIGTGLSHPLDSFNVWGTDTPVLLRHPDEPNMPWRLYDVYPARGFTGAIAVEGDPVRLSFFQHSYPPPTRKLMTAHVRASGLTII